MNPQPNSKAASRHRSALAAVIIAALMFVTAAPRLRADDQMEKCRRDAEKSEAKLDQAIAEHGKHSHEAAERMEDLRKQREHCYERLHEWWDGKDRKWHHDDDFGTDLHDRDHHPESK